jgi:hypothetical protein
MEQAYHMHAPARVVMYVEKCAYNKYIICMYVPVHFVNINVFKK